MDKYHNENFLETWKELFCDDCNNHKHCDKCKPIDKCGHHDKCQPHDKCKDKCEDKCEHHDKCKSSDKCCCDDRPCSNRNEQEICRLFKFIEKLLCNMDKDADQLKKAFCRLSDLLFEDDCISRSEREAIKTVSNDLKALKFIINKTIKDLKCLKKQVL